MTLKRKRSFTRWSDEEKALLSEFVPKGATMFELERLFPERSYMSIEHEIRTLGLKRPCGTRIDEDYVKALRKTLEV
jgi:hypothetical protein